MQILKVIFAAWQISSTAGFTFRRISQTTSTSFSRSVLKASTEDERPRVQIKRIVESLSSGTKTGVEVEQELKALQTESKLLEVSTGVAGSLIGLVTGGLLDGALAAGNAPWSAPVGFALLGGAAYYGAAQKSKLDVSEFLQSALGQPVLKAGKSVAGSIQSYISDTKAAAVKKVEDTVEEINRVPTSIIKSIVDAKDDAITRAKAVPVNIQNAASRSYEEAKQGAIDRVDQKVSEVSH